MLALDVLAQAGEADVGAIVGVVVDAQRRAVGQHHVHVPELAQELGGLLLRPGVAQVLVVLVAAREAAEAQPADLDAAQVDVLDADPVELVALVVVAVDAELGQARVGERLEVHAREVAEAQDEVDVALEQARERDVRRLVGQDEGAQAQMGIPQRGNQRSSSGSKGSSEPVAALICSSRSVLRCLSPGRGHERVPAAALVVVDQVQRLAVGVLEGEDGGQHAVVVAAHGQGIAHRVDADGEVLDVGVAHDHPAVAELVVLGLHRGAHLRARPGEDLLHVVDDLAEVAGRQRLEDDAGDAARLDALLRVEPDVGGRDREEPVGRRPLDLALAQQRVEEAHAPQVTRARPAAAPPGARGPRCASPSGGAWRRGCRPTASRRPGRCRRRSSRRGHAGRSAGCAPSSR